MISRPGNGVCNNSAREDLVTFDPVVPVHPAQKDVILRYTLGTQVAANPLDWVGIFKSGCWDTDNPLTCQWAPVEPSDGAMVRERHVVFPAKFIQALQDQTESCQFLYVSGSGHILGASQSFKVMDAGEYQKALTRTASPDAESRDAHTTNADANSYVNISSELLSSDDEWELATHEELCKTNSSTSDLSDIEILSTSPSKEAVKMKVSAAEDDDVCEFSNINTTCAVAEDATPDSCNDPRHMIAVSELQPTSLYQSINGVCQPEPEMVETKRKLKKRIQMGPEYVDNNLAVNTTIKESSKVKKLKKSSTASKKTSKPISKSKKMLNAPAPVVKMHVSNCQIVDSESSSDSQENSSVLQNCNLRKRKRKNNTEKSKWHPVEHHNILLSSESEEEIQQSNTKKAKRKRTRPKAEESQTQTCNRLTLRQQEQSDCKTTEITDKLNRKVEISQMVDHNQPEKEYVNNTKTGHGMKTIDERWRDFDENKTHKANPCNFQAVASPDESKLISRKRKKIDDSIKYRDTACLMVSAPDKMYSRKEMDANTEFKNMSSNPHNMKSQQNTTINSKIARNSDKNRKYTVIPLRLEEGTSVDRIMTHSGYIDEMRKYKVIPIDNSLNPPEKITANSTLNRDDGHLINNSSIKMHNWIFGEEINYNTKINNFDEREKHNTAKSNLQIVESMQQFRTDLKAADDVCEEKSENISISSNYEGKNDDISICNLQDIELVKKRRDDFKLTRCNGAKCFQDNTENRLKGRQLAKKLKTSPKTSSNFENNLRATAALNEHKIKESLNTQKQKLANQRRSSELGETGCKILKTSDVGGHRYCDGDWEENRSDLSGVCPWDISSKETKASTTLDCYPDRVEKKRQRKVKTRRTKESQRKRKQIKTEDGLAVTRFDQGQTQESHQNASQNITVTKVTESLALNGAEKLGWHNGEIPEADLTVGSNSAMHDVSGTPCRQKPTFEVNDERVCDTDRHYLMSGGSSVDGMGSPGQRLRKEKTSLSKIKGSQSRFKAKYKCQGRTPSGLQCLRRGEISKWRKLCRLLLVNRRRFKAAHGTTETGDEYGTIAELENTESSTECAVPKVTTREELCLQVQNPAQSLAISGSSNVRSMEAKGRQTYASVVKGTKQASSPLDQKVQEHTVIDIPYNESYAIPRDSAEGVKSEIGLAELEERSKLLCYSCVTNAEVSSSQTILKQQDTTLEHNLHSLIIGEELTRDFQPGRSGKLSVSRNFEAQAGSENGISSSDSNTCGHTYMASCDINNAILAAKTKEKENAVGTRVGDERGGKGYLGTSRERAEADGAEGNDVILNWPLPAACARTSLVEEHPECGPETPLKAECILTNHTLATVVPPAWRTEQSQTGHRGMDTPVEASMSSEFELSSSQAGQAELVDIDAAEKSTEIGQPPQSRSDQVTDDQPLIWPLPVFKSSSSKFGLGNALGYQADDYQMNSYESDQRDDLPPTWSVPPIFPDVPSFVAPIQSQLCIPRTCGLRNNLEIKAATGASAKDHSCELGPTDSRPHRQTAELRQRVNALEKQIEDLNSLLVSQQQAHLHSRGDADDVAATGSSGSDRFKPVKHKRVPSVKPDCGTKSLAKSSAETVNVKPKVRMHKTRIAALENQMKMLRETMVNATRQPLKIHVKCKKLHVKIRDGKRGVNTGQAADGGPATVTWTQEQNITQESPSLDGLVQEVHSTVEDIPANTSHLEIKTAVGSETSSRVEDCDADHHSTLGEREVCLVQKSSSDVADDDLARVATSSEQTGTPRMGYRSRVPAELARVEYHGLHQADASVEGYRGVIPQALSHEEDHLHTISPREDDSHVTSATFSRARNPDLVSSQGEKILSRLGIPDLISETTSRSENSGLARLTFPNFTSHGQIPETLPRMEITHKNQMTYSGVREYDQIRENHTRKRNCYSAGADEAEATKGTVRTFTALSSIPPGQMREHDRKFRQCTNVSDRQVVLEGMDDTADLISAAQDSPGLPHTQSTRCCSDCCFASCSCYAHAPISKVCSSEPKPCLPGSVVAPHKLQNLTMSTNMSDGNYYRTEAQSLDHHRTVATSSDHHRTLATSFDHHPLAISRPDSAALSPYLYFNSVERPFQYRNGTEICASALQPKISCLHRRAHPSSQTSQVSFSHDPHVFTSKNHDDIKHSYNSGQWTGSQQHKLTLENKDLELDEYHPSERCSPWMSFSEIASPETRCLHSAQNLGNRKLYNKQTLKLMAVNLPGSEMGYLSENKPCLCDTTENIYGPHGNYFQPDFSIKHHKSRERCEERIHGRMQRLRDEGTDSAEVDGGSHASLMLSGPRKTMDITAQNTNFTPTKYLADKTEWPASFKHTETFSSNFPCSKSERRSPNPHMYLNHRRIHDRDQYKNTKCAHSDKQRVQEDDIQHYQSLLRHRLERIPAIDDTNSSCPYQVCKDPQVLENHDYLISQTPHADQCSSIYQQHGSQSHSLLSTQYNPYIHKDVTGEHMSINYPCLSTTFTENCVERSPYCHQYVPQADQTVDQLSPSAVTEYLPKHGNYCNCFCFIDGCSQRRQIEGSQACLLNLK